MIGNNNKNETKNIAFHDSLSCSRTGCIGQQFDICLIQQYLLTPLLNQTLKPSFLQTSKIQRPVAFQLERPSAIVDF
ncbi:hypothetical protein BpHYR1_043622 [Brachionus plicatilis]|uniref:Uncharacterized protein n=1 Tax=Brachionus plicatilis TaxID=10195 RepID=A0A3M7QA75_BRAPC|nr:hypothetical protein BpHYR1_043622 [Brachionus plicatilis]